MFEIDNVSKLGNRYIYQSLGIVCLLTGIGIAIGAFAPIEPLSIPLSVCVVFFSVIGVVEGLIWKRVAKNSQDSLPAFYTAVSGFRMLLALFTLFVCCLVVGRNSMLNYCIVFMIYYFVLLVHHSAYFSHISNSHSKCGEGK